MSNKVYPAFYEQLARQKRDNCDCPYVNQCKHDHDQFCGCLNDILMDMDILEAMESEFPDL
jgi:hypothetical protein